MAGKACGWAGKNGAGMGALAGQGLPTRDEPQQRITGDRIQRQPQPLVRLPHLRGKYGGHAAEQAVPGAVLGVVPVVCGEGRATMEQQG